MKWANLLRRWTVKSLQSAILGAAFAGSANIAVAQGTAPSAAPASRFPMKSHTFDLPIRTEAAERIKLSEFRLYMRTPTTSWQKIDHGNPGIERFTVKVPQDGEYWFILATVDRAGNQNVVDLSLEQPHMRVLVDTTAPVIQVQPWTSPENDLCLRCTVLDVNSDPSTLRAVCRTPSGDMPLELVQGQPGTFRLKGGELMQYPVLVTARDLAGHVGMKEVNVREMVSGVLKTNSAKSSPGVGAITPGPEPKGLGSLPTPPDFATQPRKTETGTKSGDYVPPPPPLNPDVPKSVPGIQTAGGTKQPTGGHETTHVGSGPYQLINTTQAAIDFRIDQVGLSGIGKVELYMTPDKGQTWHRLSEVADKRSPAIVSLPGDGVFGIRIVVSNGNGFGGKAPVRGDAPHCTVEVDTTAPFVQFRSAEVVPSSGHVEIRWNATDNNLSSEPVSLFYRTRPDGAWQVVARNVKNDGLYRWAFPRDAGGQFFFKVEVADRAGNVAHDGSRQAVVIDMSEPRATVVGVSGSTRP